MEEKNNTPVQANAVQPRGRKLSGALNKSPSLAGLTRVSPGMYRDKSGNMVNSRGDKMQLRQEMPMQRPMANPTQMGQEMGNMPGVQDASYRLPPGTQPGAFGNALGNAVQGSQYTKPAITPPGGGTPQPAAPMTGGPSSAEQSSPDQLAQMAQQYRDARNYQPSFKETQGQYGMGNLQRQKFDEQARQRQRLLNDPAYMRAYMESVKQQG